MRSPILVVEKAIAASAFRIAPEQASELTSWRDESGVTLVLTDDTDFSIRVNVITNEVTLPIAALEFLWCSAHMFYVCFDEYVHNQHSGAAQFSVGACTRSAAAWKLFQWARANMLTSGVEAWPTGLPRPTVDPEARSDPHLADELFLCAIAWIIHHEFAHVRLAHEAYESPYSIRQERDADAEATAWILERSLVDGETSKRTLGITVAILALQMLDKPGRRNLPLTHPRAVERLDACLSQAGCVDNDNAFAMALVVMQIQLAHEGVQTAAPEEGSFRKMLSELMVAYVRWSVTDPIG